MNHNNFDKWNAQKYLTEYYQDIHADEQHTLTFLCEEARKIKGNPIALEFGAGPTIHHILPISPYVSEIHMADYLLDNLNELENWQTNKSSHNWDKFLEYVVRCDSKDDALFNIQDQIRIRENLTRQRMTQFLQADASRQLPIDRDLPGIQTQYDVLVSCYCVDSATHNREEWHQYMTNIMSLLRPSGFILLAALRNCQTYRIGDFYFPSANINENDFVQLFAQYRIKTTNYRIQVAEVPENTAFGYGSIVLASAFLP